MTEKNRDLSHTLHGTGIYMPTLTPQTTPNVGMYGIHGASGYGSANVSLVGQMPLDTDGWSMEEHARSIDL